MEQWEEKKKKIYQEAMIRHEAELKAQDGREERRRRKRADREGGGPTINVVYPPTPDFDAEILTDSGKEMPMYFTHPQQLLNVFIALEEQNLFLIQNSQETEQALEDLKTSYRETRKKMDVKTTSLEENIQELKIQIAGEEGKKAQLAKR